jgi:hypothetical protein
MLVGGAIPAAVWPGLGRTRAVCEVAGIRPGAAESTSKPAEVVARRRYARALLITERGAGRMTDVYIIESWFGERLNVRSVYAADADDALQTHELHYPGEHIVSVQRGDGLGVR